MPDKKYEEIGNNYRFFLGWRHAAFAGNLIVLYGAISLTLSTYKDSASIAWLVPAFASPIGILLWVIDVRTRDLYHAAIEAGKKLEGNDGGFYTQLADKVKLSPGTSPFNKITQSGALNILFWGSSLVLMATAVVFFMKTNC